MPSLTAAIEVSWPSFRLQSITNREYPARIAGASSRSLSRRVIAAAPRSQAIWWSSTPASRPRFDSAAGMALLA